MSNLDEQMAEALRLQAKHALASAAVDRREWTPREWCENAKRLMSEPDGAITSLVNGHAVYLIRERDRLIGELEGIRDHGKCSTDREMARQALEQV